MEKHLAGTCMVCDTALEGPVGSVMRVFGIHRSTQNPNLCNRCGTHFEEGKVVELTVLFADMVGFTTMTHELGPEKTYDIVEAFFQKANTSLIKHDAFIDKYIGDAVMALFNAPIQHMNHAEKALAAAFDIQDAIPDLSKHFNRDIQIRVGIASGYARVGNIGSKDRKDYTAVGDAVNLASRLEARANPGEVLMDNNGFKMVAEKFPHIQPEYLNVKGFKDPIRAFRVRSTTKQKPLIESIHIDSGRTSSFGSVLFAILGAPCAIASLLGPLSLLLGAGALLGAAAPFFEALDAAIIRIPLQSIAVLGALANLYVIWRGYRKFQAEGRQASITLDERRKTWLVGSMAVITLLAVGFEIYAHVYLNHMGLF